MNITVEAINHVGLVVRDLRAAERFYVDVLGFERLVERKRRILRRRVDRRRAALGHGAGGTNQDPVVAAGRTVRCRGIAARAKL